MALVSVRSLRRLAPTALCSLLALARGGGAAAGDGEEARWLVQASTWATMAWMEGGELKSLVTSMAESDGRLFFYLMENATFPATITLSEAQVDPSQYFGARCGPDGALDPQDPRCAKLSITGTVSPCADDESKELALSSLFRAHPQMEEWPDDHGFLPCEMKIHDRDGLWMIANFGGGGFMQASDYFAAEPAHHAVQGFDGTRSLAETGACYDPSSHECECLAECGEAPCQAAGGIWTQECGTTCDCASSEGMGGHGDGNGVGGHGNGGGNDRGEGMREHGGWGGHVEGSMGGGHGHGDGMGEGHGHGGGMGGGHGHGHSGGMGGGHEHSDHGAGSLLVLPMLPRPEFENDAAGHGRWIVAKSLWTTLSTVSSSKEGRPFGNIRSIADGACFLGSSGLPYFYLPGPDPSAVDIQSNPKVALSFTEAALGERVGSDGRACGGKDAEDPTCAKLTLVGTARALEGEDRIAAAKEAFQVQHPRASWLSSGGAHTGGNYYTLDLEDIVFLRNYGGFTAVSPAEYLNWKPDASKLTGEPPCGPVGGGSATSQAAASTAAPTSSNSAGIVAIVVLASFVGSFAGGLVSDKLKGAWHAKRGGYAEASSVENTVEPEEGDVTSKTWV